MVHDVCVPDRGFNCVDFDLVVDDGIRDPNVGYSLTLALKSLASGKISRLGSLDDDVELFVLM